MVFIELLKSLLYGIVEGITEWLPVSSTGHLILLGEWLPFDFSNDETFKNEFNEMFEVVIQLGAILAVIILFWSKLWPFSRKKAAFERKNTFRLWSKVLVACIPAAVAGTLLDALIEALTDRDINGWLYKPVVVAVALIVYGIAFIIIEAVYKNKKDRITCIEDISYPTALTIGAFQALAILPGTSRSGSTILGSRLLGVSRSVAAEFSFFMAIPVMAGASGIKVLGFFKWVSEYDYAVPVAAWGTLAVGFVSAFAVSFVAIRFLMDFVKKHSFSPFGVYRVILGLFVLGYFLLIK